MGGSGDSDGGGGGGKEAGTPRLSIFDTFKTRTDQLTGEAVRQRAIISILASDGNPSENTRTAIAQAIAGRSKIPWKNIYSGIFRDFDEVLIPLGLVREEGRLPLKRGPKALQEKGVPYYALTGGGVVAAASFEDAGGGDGAAIRAGVLGMILKGLKKGGGYGDGSSQMDALGEAGGILPGFAGHVFEGYVRSYCRGEVAELIPVSADKIRLAHMGGNGGLLEIYRELLGGFSQMGRDGRRAFAGFLDSVVPASRPVADDAGGSGGG